MLKFTDFMTEVAKYKKEELHPNQKKLDKNNNGKLDSDDFKKLRATKEESHCGDKEKDDDMEEGFVSHAQRKAVWASRNEKGVKEEVEQIDEISKKTLGSYVKKAAHDIDYKSGENKELELTEPDDDEERDRHDKQRRDVENRHKGIKTAIKKLTKEEVEQIEYAIEDLSIEELEEFMMSEEYEQLDELSKATLASYIPKAARSSRIHGMVSKDYASAAERKRNPGLKNALNKLSNKYKSKAWKRQDGIKRAADKLAKEEVEQIDELSKKTLGSYVKKASADITKREVRIDRAMDASGSNYNEPSMQKALNKNVKRVAGLNKAADKLTKEEVELDEGRMKDLDYDLKNMGHSEFHKQYGKPKSHYDSTKFKKPVQPGKEMDRARALAQRGLQSVLSKEDTMRFPKDGWSQNDSLAKPVSSSKAMADHSQYFKKVVKLDPKTGKPVKEEVEQVDEVLSKNAPAGEWVKDFVDSDNPKFAGKSKEKRRQMALAAYYAKQRNEEVEMMSFNEFINKLNEAKSCKKEEAEIDESAIDDLKDKLAIKKADPKYHYSKSYKANTDKKSNVTVHKARSYGAGEEDNDEDDENKTEPKVKRGRGRPAGSKPGSYTRR